MVRVCDGATLPNADKAKIYMLRVYGKGARGLGRDQSR